MRVSVAGTSGVGKTTFARRLAGQLGVPFLELDSIYHQANWTPLPDDEFRARVREFVGGDAWVVDGNYGAVRPIVLDRATHVAWLDYSKARVMRQVISRSFRRAVFRPDLWNGNRESMRNWVDADHPIRWSWSNYERKHAEYGARFASSEYAHLHVTRFGRPRDAEAYLRHCKPA